MSGAATVNTRKAPRRELGFESMQDILADAERLAHGTIRTTGNWSAAQIIQHVARVVVLSLDGFDARVALPMRIMGRLMRKRALTSRMPAGFKIPGVIKRAVPETEPTMDAAMDELRSVIARTGTEQMTEPSPLLGPMTHDDWVNLHCRHAEMHFGFMEAG